MSHEAIPLTVTLPPVVTVPVQSVGWDMESYAKLKRYFVHRF